MVKSTADTTPNTTIDRAVFLTGPTMHHVVSMTLMGSLGLVSMFLVDLTDIYFLSLLHDRSIIAGMGYAATVTYFITAVSIGLSVTAASFISRAVGAGDNATADRLVAHMLLFSTLSIMVICGLLYPYLQDILFAIGASRKTAMYAQDYLEIIVPSAVFVTLAICTSGMLRSFGDGRRAMHITLMGALVNLVLDPIFIFVLDMGIEGAAMSTVLSRFVMVCVGLYGLFEIHKVKWVVVPEKIMADISMMAKFAGVATTTNLSSPTGNMLVMLWLAPYGDAVISAWSVYGRLVPVLFGMTFALSGAVGPIIGQNYGAGDMQRVRATVWNALIFSIGIVGCTSLIAYVFRYDLANAFSLTGDSVSFFVFLLEYVSWFFVFNGLVFIASAVFNSLGVPKYSTLCSWTRHVVGIVPFVMLGGWLYGAKGVILFANIGGVVFGTLAYVFALRYIDRVKKNQNLDSKA